jgi:hypothetical protein
MMRRHAPRRGSILILVLAVLAMLTILGGTLSRSIYNRALSVQYVRHGGTPHVTHATIGEGAAGAPSNEGSYGSPTISAGGDDRLRSGTDR